MPISREVKTPLIVHSLQTVDQHFAAFLVQIRLLDSEDLLVDTEISGRKEGKVWRSAHYEFSDAIKGRTYEIRVATKDQQGNPPQWTEWWTETAGDNEFGTANWTLELESTSTGLIYTVTLDTPPPDLDRIEIHIRKPDDGTAQSPSGSIDLGGAGVTPNITLTGHGLTQNDRVLVTDADHLDGEETVVATVVDVDTITLQRTGGTVYDNVPQVTPLVVDTSTHAEWTPYDIKLVDALGSTASFEYIWTGPRNRERYFYVKAVDRSGNKSGLSSGLNEYIPDLDTNDLDRIPPVGSVLKEAYLEDYG